ncbi:MAG TPA: hypothetical protein EYG03_13105 [Planctomycetes bacterium]|nr:hypothetical protein [Fuerstiella sp.]HIK92901.1 hypothetical protein [Planctomycetota bacterium]
MQSYLLNCVSRKHNDTKNISLANAVPSLTRTTMGLNHHDIRDIVNSKQIPQSIISVMSCPAAPDDSGQ